MGRIKTLFFALCLGLASAAMAAPKTQLTWYGHSAFKITTPAGHVLLVDPWITNPSNPNGKEDLAALKHVDLILITHGHFDHVGDAVEIAKRTGAKLVSIFELGEDLVRYDRFPAKQAGFDTQGNLGGTLNLLDGDVKVTFVPALHSSSLAVKVHGRTDVHYAGAPCGFLIQVKDGPTFYHTGDTALFSDMALIPRIHRVDVMMACIGDHFTMGPEGAAQAVKWVNPRVVVPMHYGTFPVLTGTPEAFRKALHKVGAGAKLDVMKVGETLDF